MPYADQAKQKKYRADRYRTIYQTDEEFRASEAERKAAWFAECQDARQRMKERYRLRYATDPSFRKRELERAREKYLKKSVAKATKEKRSIKKKP